MTVVPWTDRVAAPLDGIRRAAFAAAVESRSIRTLVTSRDRRLAWTLAAHACAAFAMTVLFPAPLLVLVPLVLGVPHVASDLRYLVLKRVVEPSTRLSVFLACGALLGVAVLGLFRAPFDVVRAEVILGSTAVGAAGWLAFARSRHTVGATRRTFGAAMLGGIALLGVLAAHVPRTATVVLLHAHNVVALVIWAWMFRKSARRVIPSVFLVAGLAVLLASGALIPETLRFGAWRAFGTNLLATADWLAPGLPDRIAVGLASSWIFMQAVHYLVWLVLVPADARAGSGTVTFRRTFRDLKTDFGVVGLCAIAATSALVCAFGARAPLATRNAYLALASFHVWLELGVLVAYAVGGSDVFRAARPRGRRVTA